VIPNFFIVGAPKCGTTAMYQWLLAHPKVYLPAKEIHYFGRDLDHQRPALTEAEYRGLYDDAQTAHQAVGDVAVWHLMSETAASEIHALAPEARIIIMLRRPDEMLYSLHSQLVYSGEEDLTDFAEALGAEADRADGRRVQQSTHAGLEAPPTQCLLYRRVASFAQQVARYQDTFDQVHVVLHDDLRADQAAAYRKVLDFLEVDPDFQPDFSVVNPNTTVKSQAARKAIQRLRWGPVRSVVPGPLRSIGRKVMEGLQSMNTEVTQRPPLDPDLAARLREELSGDIEALGTRIDRDLSAWLRPPVS
jgi:hypothetical protein